jgi:hypothetical protein
MKLFVYFLILLLLVGCNTEKSLQEKFVNDENYWAVYDEADPGFHVVYYKFTQNNKSDRYCGDTILHKCKGGCLVETDVPWEVTEDSVLTWGINKYHIIKCTDDVIVLFTSGELKRHKILVKEYPNNLHKGKAYYEELVTQEKYK